MAERPRLIEPSSGRAADTEIRDRVYRAIAAHVREKTGGEISRASPALGREILDVVTEIVIRTAIKEGYFRLPSGFGSLKVLKLRTSTKRLPTGEVVELTEPRSRLRYEEGAAVRELLGMPYKTSYRRQYLRQSKVLPKALDIAFPDAQSA